MIKVNEKYHMLTVIELVKIYKKDKPKLYRTWARCKCDCGKDIFIRANNIHNGQKSCGCLRVTRKPRLTHGYSRSKIYKVWATMKNRCYREKTERYKNYGGRGIKVCSEWLSSSEAFIKWALANGYREGLTLERKNNDGNYEPNNCSWETLTKQSNNKQNTVILELNGVRKSLSEWSEATGIKRSTIYARVKKGWPIELALGIDIITAGFKLKITDSQHIIVPSNDSRNVKGQFKARL